MKPKTKKRKARPLAVALAGVRVGDKILVTASHNGDKIHFDTIDFNLATQRERFIKGVCKRRTGVDAAALDAQLMKLPATLPVEDQPMAEANHDAAPQLVKVTIDRLPDGTVCADHPEMPRYFDNKIDCLSPRHRKQFIAAIAEKVPNVDTADVEEKLLNLAEQRIAKCAKPKAMGAEADPLSSMPADIRAEAEAMLLDPQLIQRIVDDIEAMNVAGEKELTATVYLIGVSRLLPKPLAGRVHGPSSSGKSHLIEKVAALFPPEAVIHSTQMTPQALFHMPADGLRNKWIVAGERSRVEDDDRAETTRALREMISAGKLTKLMPVKGEGNKIETILIEQDGPIAFTESTTLSKVFDEDANRCLTLHTDERKEQSRRIINQLAEAVSVSNGVKETDRIVLRHHALQRMLRPMPVIVPFARWLGQLMPADRVEVRRAFLQLVSAIQAITLLHQRQRSHDEYGALIATVADYQLAEFLLQKPMEHLLGSAVSEPARRFLERLREWTTDEFTTKEAKLREKSCKSSVAGWLVTLHDAGLVDLVEHSKGNKPARWRLANTAEAISTGVLPTLEQVFPTTDRNGWTQCANPWEVRESASNP
ncbi:MAG: hypothetical protein ACJ8C4_13285 [Gemmataceae bacterium]